jgi:hypothetical protein
MPKSAVVLWIAATLLSTAALPVSAEPVTLRCDVRGGGEFQLLFETSGESARLALDDETVAGRVTVSDTHYHFVFPESKDRHETRIAVNRFSGAMTWELTSASTGDSSQSNVSRFGTCRKVNNKPSM